MALAGDPVGTGFVSNLARPGANVTGISTLTGELAGKRLSLLKQLVPGARRIAVLFNPADPVTRPQIQDAERAAPVLGVEVLLGNTTLGMEDPERFRPQLPGRRLALRPGGPPG
ncbi:MAG: hypothetical protein DMD38_16360 [Gemmatimonadetes bacterium]|nr:MAG: hypothetical protein DMD38_16360 [Gemmatimonadota bacterium]